jgi:hypothetical protein
MYKPNFPSNFPSAGVWEITYFDEYEKDHPLHTQRVLVTEHMGQFRLMRQKTKDAWDHMMGDKCLMKSTWKEGSEPYYMGQWRMYTWMSIIHLTSVKRI